MRPVHFTIVGMLAAGLACTLRDRPTLAGDWDAYLASGSMGRPGFEAWRRMGFAQFTQGDSGLTGAIRRRTGEAILEVARVTTRDDSVTLSGRGDQSLSAAWHGDTLVGLMLADGQPAGRRVRLVRRATPFVVEKNYALWPGPVSDSQYAITEDTLVFMTTRDGTRLASYVARPVGDGPFGVVLQRTPYNRLQRSAGRFWASRGYIYVAQHVRGRDVSGGNDFGDYDTDVRDGYDAVEWAAKLPGANGRVGMIGHSDEGRLAWYAAVSAPPHLAALAPSAATGDPWRIVPYMDMAFSPTIVAWACLMRARTMQSITEVEMDAAIQRLPVSDLPERLGCGRIPMWDRWIAHPALDTFWRARAVTSRIANVRVPVLQISGWYDDARGPIDYFNALDRVPGHPLNRLVMGPGAHKGVDYVAGEFGPESRIDRAPLQLRWFDHYLLGKDNGVDREPPVDIFVIGDNTWRKEAAWPLARAVPTKWYLASGGNANTSAGDGVLDTIAPAGAPADTFTYDPANPTPYLIDSRELELSLNEDYTALNASRRDALVFTSKPLAGPIEVTGQLSATIWAATDAKDTDWNVMLLDVFPDGHAERVQDGLARARFRKGFDKEVLLDPGSVERYDIDLWFTSRVFATGHRIRVSVSSALFPKYGRNLNTGGSNERDSTFVVAHQRLVHDATHPSHVVLPVVRRGPESQRDSFACNAMMALARPAERIVADAALHLFRRAEHLMAMSAVPKRRWTIEEVEQLIEERERFTPRYELVDGELLVTPGPSHRHQRIVGALFLLLHPYVMRHRLGEALMSPGEVRLTPASYLEPDVYVVPGIDGRRPRVDVIVDRLLLAAEVLSPSSVRHDRIIKRRFFQAHGVPDYWVVDGDAEAFEVWRPSDERAALLDETLTWHPEGASEPLIVNVRQFFAEISDD